MRASRRSPSDLERAQAARAAADETEAAWRARMDAARAEAARLAQEAKQASARETEAKVKRGRRQDQRARSKPPKRKIRDAVAVGARRDRGRRGRSDAGHGRAPDRHPGRSRKEAADAVKAELNV